MSLENSFDFVVRRRVGIPAGAAARRETRREKASGGGDEQPRASRFSSERYPRSRRSGARRWFARLEHPREARGVSRVGSALRRTRTGVSGSSRRRAIQHRGRRHREDDGRRRARRVAEAQAGVLRAHQPGSRERCGDASRFRLEAVVLFFRPVVLVQSFFFYQVEKSRRASSLLPFGRVQTSRRRTTRSR